MSSFFALIFLLILPFVFIYSFRRPDLFRIKNNKNPKGQWSRGLFSAWWFAAWVLSLAMVGVFSKPLPEAERQEIVRKVAAEMNAEPDAKAVITVQDDGAVVVDPIIEPVSYKIISDEKMATIKRTVQVMLDKPVTEEQLRDLANKIHAMDAQKYERTFIMYSVKGVELPSGMAWATSHFNPNLNVEILADQHVPDWKSPNVPEDFEYPKVDLSVPVSRVDLYSDQAIVKAAGVPVTEVSDSTDNKGEPKKIYQFGDGLNTQIELSRSEIIIGWDFPDLQKEPEYKYKNLKNLKIAQTLGRAVLSGEGGKMIDDMVAGKRFSTTVIDGITVKNASCVVNSCLLKIAR